MNVTGTLEAIGNLSIAVVCVLTLAVVIWTLVKLITAVLKMIDEMTKTNKTLGESMEKVVSVVNSNEQNDNSFRDVMLVYIAEMRKFVQTFTEKPFVCEAQKVLEEMKKQKFSCPRLEEMKKQKFSCPRLEEIERLKKEKELVQK